MPGNTTARRAAALFGWLNQVKGDASLPASAFKVAFELGQWINGDAFERESILVAWPSLETIASAIGMSERTARDMVKRLQLRGHLSIKTGHGPGHPSRYTFSIKNRQPAATITEEETGSSLPLSSEQNRKPASRKPAQSDTETGSRLPTNHLEPCSNHGESERATLLPGDFELDRVDLAWAVEQLGTEEAVRRSIAHFRNHFAGVVGQTAHNRNWPARARKWILDDANKSPVRKSAVSADRLSDKSFDGGPISWAEWEDVVATFARTKHWTRYVSRFGSPPTSPECRAPRELLIKYGVGGLQPEVASRSATAPCTPIGRHNLQGARTGHGGH